MLKEYRAQSILGIWGGAFFFALGYFFAHSTQGIFGHGGRVIMIAGYFLFVLGCFMYAKGKGRSIYWGILGISGPIGLLVIYCLSDKSKIVLKKRQKEQN